MRRRLLLSSSNIIENPVATLISEDSSIEKNFSTYESAASYAKSYSTINWKLIAITDAIPSSCFSSIRNIISLTLEDGVTSIGQSAFSSCSGITGDLVIPDSVTSIGTSAFTSCTGFTGTLTIGSGLTEISDYCFRACGFIGKLTIPSNITSIGYWSFSQCNFTGSLEIDKAVTYISDYAFNGCDQFDDILTYTGLSNPGMDGSTENTHVFSNTNFTTCGVPDDYTDDTFCGLPILKDYEETVEFAVLYEDGTEETYDDFMAKVTAVYAEDVAGIIVKGWYKTFVLGLYQENCNFSDELLNVREYRDVFPECADSTYDITSDYDGEARTQALISCNNSEECAYVKAYNQTILNGTRHGYIASSGEWKYVHDNINTITAILNKIINADGLVSERYWLSNVGTMNSQGYVTQVYAQGVSDTTPVLLAYLSSYGGNSHYMRPCFVYE